MALGQSTRGLKLRVEAQPRPLLGHRVRRVQAARLVHDLSDGCADAAIARSAWLRQALPPGMRLLAAPGTRSRDLVRKRRAYEQEGVASYWIVDPKAPAVTVLELVDGAYQEVARVPADQAWTAALPYVVTIVPRHLLR